MRYPIAAWKFEQPGYTIFGYVALLAILSILLNAGLSTILCQQAAMFPL